MEPKSCMYCGKLFGLLESKYIVKTPVKPKGEPNRYAKCGECCEECESIGKPLLKEK